MSKLIRKDARECWKCSRNGKGDPYCWQKCLGPAEVSNKGLNVVSLDAMPSPSEFVENYVDHTYKASKKADVAAVTNELSISVERALVPIIANLMSLSDIELCIFRHLFHGEGLEEMGRSLPKQMTKQAVHKRLKTMCANNKVVEKVIRGMMRTGTGGAKPTTTQLSLFDEMGLCV